MQKQKDYQSQVDFSISETQELSPAKYDLLSGMHDTKPVKSNKLFDICN